MTENTWEGAERLVDKHTQEGSIFVKLSNDGDKVVGAFCGAPFARDVVWTGEHYETFDPAVHAGVRPTLRVALNIFVPAEGQMKIIEGGPSWFKDVRKVRDKYGLDQWLFEVERHGKAGDSKTRYTVLPESRIDDELRARIEEAELHDLERLCAGGGGDPADSALSSYDRKAGTTIDARAAVALSAALKTLPREAVETFLKKLGITRLKDLPAAKLEQAQALVQALLAQNGEPDGANEAIVPF